MILVFLAAMAAAADFETEAQVSEKLQDLEEKNAELQDQLAALRATCGTRCPRAVASAPVKAKAPQTPAPLVEEKKEEVPEQSAPEATPTPDPKIAELQAEVVRLAAENARLQQEIEIFKAALDRPVEVTLQAPQDPAPEVTVEVNPVVHEKETVNVRVSGFHPLIYGGAGMVFGRPVPEVSGTVSVRFAGGVLPMWDISEKSAFGLFLEGDYMLKGWGVRAIPEFIAYNNFGSLGFGLGVEYNCDGLTNLGCMAERTGGVGRVSWLSWHMISGVLLFADVGILNLSVPGDRTVETRFTLGIAGYFGNSRRKVVRVE